MNPPSIPTRSRLERGLTLIEVTLVVGVLLGLIGATMVGMSSYKEGVNRALCIHQVANVQKAMRSYCHFQELQPGQSIPDLKFRLIEDSQFFASAPFCPAGGTYLFYKEKVPNVGELFMQCALPEHTPKETDSW